MLSIISLVVGPLALLVVRLILRRVRTIMAMELASLSEIIKVGRFERLVYLSSTRLYDSQTKNSVAETEPLLIDPSDPRRIYDLSKALGENLTVTRTGGRGVAARLANVYDWEAGAPGFLSEWLIRAASERDLRLDSSPNVVRDYIHLDDVVTALIELADKRATGIVNVASGELISNAEIADLFETAGWKVSFTGAASAAPPPNVKIWRLEALGVRPRRVEDVVRGHLAGLKA